MSVSKLPIQVESIISSRYPNNARPPSWDERKEGTDVVRTVDGQTIKLWSDGGQSPPKRGWKLILTGQTAGDAYRWTVYGMPAARAH